MNIAVSDSNEVTITKGDIWSFTVSNNILVEDFESYLSLAGPCRQVGRRQ